MKRKPPVGSIIQINLDNSICFYGQVLKTELVIFDYTKSDLNDLNVIARLPVLFFISVYYSAYRNDNWVLLGKQEIREELKQPPYKFIQDAFDENKFQLYEPNTGEITPATRQQCEGLERCAVWEANHLEDRLKDFLAGQENIWLKQMEIK